MISHKHKCIFIHVPKVAGISIEDVFLEDIGLDFRNRMPLLLGKNTNLDWGPSKISHLTAEEYLGLKFVTNDMFLRYFKFSFVRNPYDRVYSFYTYLGFYTLVSFQEFVIKYLPKVMQDERNFYFVQPMYNYIYSKNGEKLVDFVGKLENLSQDFKTVAQVLGLDGFQPGHKNGSKTISYKSQLIRGSRIVKKYPWAILGLFRKKSAEKRFDEKMKAIVLDIYEKDFQYFDYSH